MRGDVWEMHHLPFPAYRRAANYVDWKPNRVFEDMATFDHAVSTALTASRKG